MFSFSNMVIFKKKIGEKDLYFFKDFVASKGWPILHTPDPPILIDFKNTKSQEYLKLSALTKSLLKVRNQPISRNFPDTLLPKKILPDLLMWEPVIETNENLDMLQTTE